MHHAFSPGGEHVSRHALFRCWPCRWSCMGVRSCAALVMLLALAVIFPLFFTDTLRHMNYKFRPVNVFVEPVLHVDLVDIPLFKKQPRDRLNRGHAKYLDPTFALVIRRLIPFYFESDDLFYEARTENSLYGDLLQTSSVVDAYHNQTRLVLSFFEWGAEHCQGAKFIGKADEDTWINIFGVLKYLQLPEASEKAVVGHFLHDEAVKRLPEEKWFLTIAEYGNKTYPPFAVGQLYVFPKASINSVLSASKLLRIHWLDDVYIGGQIPELLRLSLIHVWERAHLWEIDSQHCFAKKYFIIHATPAERKREIFYDPCMETYRKETCQAHLGAQAFLFTEAPLTVPNKKVQIPTLPQPAQKTTNGRLSYELSPFTGIKSKGRNGLLTSKTVTDKSVIS
ncbi:hypothetical protein BV898_12209 [Hypsibius exemplaris]|uniref:Hexosyltransferase n=1 Tax=Hypsibius exemplaris TaxID=2072580 RepID=A0A1W0WEG8_HYPEX|nr:hypothetical protein BV898_12209 [Hypsibius exemplaris]